MNAFFAFLGATIGGWIGWAAGEHVGIMTAYMLSVVGTAVGVYAGRRFADGLME